MSTVGGVGRERSGVQRERKATREEYKHNCIENLPRKIPAEADEDTSGDCYYGRCQLVVQDIKATGLLVCSPPSFSTYQQKWNEIASAAGYGELVSHSL